MIEILSASADRVRGWDDNVLITSKTTVQRHRFFRFFEIFFSDIRQQQFRRHQFRHSGFFNKYLYGADLQNRSSFAKSDGSSGETTGSFCKSTFGDDIFDNLMFWSSSLFFVI